MSWFYPYHSMNLTLESNFSWNIFWMVLFSNSSIPCHLIISIYQTLLLKVQRIECIIELKWWIFQKNAEWTNFTSSVNTIVILFYSHIDDFTLCSWYFKLIVFIFIKLTKYSYQWFGFTIFRRLVSTSNIKTTSKSSIIFLKMIE